MTKSRDGSFPETTRNFKLTLEPVAGGITMFYAFVNGSKVIQAEGGTKRSWSGKVSDAQIKVKIRVVGIGKAEFRVGIDLPGTADDQSLTFKLEGGYYETEFTL